MEDRVWTVCLLVILTLGCTEAQTQTNFTRPIFHCGGHLVVDSGIVASEGFPSHYKPNSKCIWYITVPEGHVVMLSFRLFDMEPDPTCRYDYLDVYNGHSRLVQKLGRFCGTFRPGALISTSNTMMLEMVSDEATGGRGFLASFSAGKPHVEENQFCGGRLTKAQGSLKTPNWPNSDYPAGISCSWYISVEPSNVIEVKFEKIDLEPDTYCRYDYVALFNGGESDDSRRIGIFCGDRSPGTIVTNGNELLVQFVSDLSVTSDGFMAHYSSVPRGSRTPTAGGDFIYGPKTTSMPQKKPVRPSKPTKPTTQVRPGIQPKPTKKPLVKKPKKPVVKPTMKPKPPNAIPKVLVKKPTPKPRTKPTPKPKIIKPTLKPSVKVKPTRKPFLKTKPTLKPAVKPVKPTPKSGLKPAIKPKTKPNATDKPGLSKTVTKKPVVVKKPLPLNPLCTQPCKRTGTLQSSFCPHDFVITGKVTSLTAGPAGSSTIEVFLIKAYKTGRLNISLNYVLMGKVDEQGNGNLSPSSFTLLYKPVHANALVNLSRKTC
ncbi:Procollagen C-endopeptidase enhancer 1 Procollagen COOH-terminal proteinase enhancer 1 [Channa argus]|uniref:Procollagen C-endopeptidase enhancer 1 Procollagen COOH-terminal proteinase enhancer 1 n=1 Tax=Channa argus TaxID=215402 RepID=A0A6G1Q5V9_CHAAH|nr:Procollagen C-endopeptidase enhancer 1 Procollagen COOH-terminal proteinase enhancer 1 [Channa argus]